MSRHRHYIPIQRCVVCNVAGRPVTDFFGRPKGGWHLWSPPRRWVCPDHAHLKPGQWAGARALLSTTNPR